MVDGIPLQMVTFLKYLGRQVAPSNNDWPALYRDLKKGKRTLDHHFKNFNLGWSNKDDLGHVV
jgi:hypothetical protein